MFKVPDWGDDIPKGNASFEKKSKRKEKAALKKTNSVINSPKVNNVVNKKHSRVKKPKFKPRVDNYSPRINNPVISRNNSTPTINKFSPRVNKATSRLNKVHNSSHIINNTNKKHNNVIIPETINKSNDTKTPRKRELEKNPSKTKPKSTKQKLKSMSVEESEIFNTDIPDEELINVKKRKLNESMKNDDREDLLFTETRNVEKSVNNSFTPSNKINNKKEKLKKILDLGNRTAINVSGNKLRQRMLERLKAAQFRYLNEKLYTSSGSEAQQLFQCDPSAFQTYHQGYQLQVKKWPVNPLDIIVKRIIKMPKTHTIADMGCGEAALRKRVPHTVRSFDLVATTEGVEVCDMAHTPLLSSSVDVAVYCLALMGTQLTQYLIEANRVLKMGGHLLVAEVESRFDNVEAFTHDVQRLGFTLKNLDKTNKVFFFMEFVKVRDPPAKKAKLPDLSLKPCLYKRR